MAAENPMLNRWRLAGGDGPVPSPSVLRLEVAKLEYLDVVNRTDNAMARYLAMRNGLSAGEGEQAPAAPARAVSDEDSITDVLRRYLETPEGKAHVHASALMQSRDQKLDELTAEALRLSALPVKEMASGVMAGLTSVRDGTQSGLRTSLETLEKLVAEPHSVLGTGMGSLVEAGVDYIKKHTDGRSMSPVDEVEERKLDAALLRILESQGVAVTVKRDLLDKCSFIDIGEGSIPTILSPSRYTCEQVKARIIHFPRLDDPDRWLCFDIEALVAYIRRQARELGLGSLDDGARAPELLHDRIPHPWSGNESEIRAMQQQSYTRLLGERMRRGESTRDVRPDQIPRPFRERFTADELRYVLEWHRMWTLTKKVCNDASMEQVQQMVDVGSRIMPRSAIDSVLSRSYHAVRSWMQSFPVSSHLLGMFDWFTQSTYHMVFGYLILALLRMTVCFVIRHKITFEVLRTRSTPELLKALAYDMVLGLIGRFGDFVIKRFLPVMLPKDKWDELTKAPATTVGWATETWNFLSGVFLGIGKWFVSWFVSPDAVTDSWLARLAHVFFPSSTTAAMNLTAVAIGGITLFGAIGLGSVGGVALMGVGALSSVLSLAPFMTSLAGLGGFVASVYAEKSAYDDAFRLFATMVGFSPFSVPVRPEAFMAPGLTIADLSTVPFQQSEVPAVFVARLAKGFYDLKSEAGASSVVARLWANWDMGFKGEDPGRTWSLWVWQLANGDAESLLSMFHAFGGLKFLELLYNILVPLARGKDWTAFEYYRFPEWMHTAWRNIFVSSGVLKMVFQIGFDTVYLIKNGADAPEDVAKTWKRIDCLPKLDHDPLLTLGEYFSPKS